MNSKPLQVQPAEIEKKSFEIISRELGDRVIPAEREAIVKRVIHTTADFDYVESLCFSPDAVEKGLAALKEGAVIVTDTQMARSGVNKAALAKLGGRVECFMSDEDVAAAAKAAGTTRATASMDKAAALPEALAGGLIMAVGNAPTALIRLDELMKEGKIKPALIIGVPVGFVNVVESKELIMNSGASYIVARGRKGGSNVAAAICTALLYQATGRRL